MPNEPSAKILLLEIPDELYEVAEQCAAWENSSLNDLVLKALREFMEGA